MPFQSVRDGGSQLTLTAVEDMVVVYTGNVWKWCWD